MSKSENATAKGRPAPASYTAGPWAYDPADGMVIAEGRADIAGVCDYSEANARLIAAAPEMYEILSRLCAWHSTPNRTEDWAKAFAVLAKARGEAV